MTCERRLGKLLGLPAILEGRQVGRVEKAVIAPEGDRMRGLMIRRGFGGAKWAGEGDILVLGEVCVVLKRLPRRMPRHVDFALRSVRDTGGMPLGWVTDAYVQTDSFRLTALEISLGWTEELQGRRYLAYTWRVIPGTDEVMIPCGCILEKQMRARR